MPAVGWSAVSSPRIVALAPGSPAARAGLQVGDEVLTVAGEVPRDVIRWKWLTDDADPVLDVRRGGLEVTVAVAKPAGQPLGVEVQSALFDQLRTCDNHCEFCFIYQLPPGLRRSLYLKDDDYRLSFLYGNFTTLTRFTEADLERVVTEGLSPLNVSIHATDPAVRTEMLRNRRGATSLRWLRALLDHGVEVHGQIVCCPGLNDGAVLDDTLAGVLDAYPELASLCVVPLGVSRFNQEARMRPTTAAEAGAVIDAVEDWQDVFLRVLGHRLVFAADEYYLLAGRAFPASGRLRGLRHARGRHRHGPGVRAGVARPRPSASTGAGAGLLRLGRRRRGRRTLRGGRRLRRTGGGLPRRPLDRDRRRRSTRRRRSRVVRRRSAPVAAPRCCCVRLRARRSACSPASSAPGSSAPLVEGVGRDDVRVIPVENRFFGGTTSVTGLLVGEDLARVLADQPEGHRYLLPDVCLSGDRFLDGTSVADLPRPVEVVATDGAALRRALEAR